jgi:hypothetical protein
VQLEKSTQQSEAVQKLDAAVLDGRTINAKVAKVENRRKTPRQEGEGEAAASPAPAEET